MSNIQAYTLRIVQNDGRKRDMGVARCTLTARNITGKTFQVALNTKVGQAHLNVALDVLGRALDETA